MKIEYQNGVRVTQLVHEQTVFERMLDRYSEMVKAHYTTSSNSTLTEQERKTALKESLLFLERERRHLESMADVQAQLDTYREAGMMATRGGQDERNVALTTMRAESHHPTEVLEKYMRAEGVPKPSSKHTAHHIVPGKGKIKILTNRTRVHLHIYGIRINDPANGVYLVHKDEDTPHWSMPKSRGHLTYHTHDYERWLSQKIRAIKNIDLIKTQLQLIGGMLQANEPKQTIPSSKKC